MKKSKKILSVLLALIMMITIIPLSSITASAEIITGSCGDNLTWTFDELTGTLTISGTGDMYDYDYHNNISPWNGLGLKVKNVIINEGTTKIGEHAFSYSDIESVTIPNSVIVIGNSAFCECLILDNITIPNSVTTIGASAFNHCINLTRVTISENVVYIGDLAFNECYYMQEFIVDENNANYMSDDKGVLYSKDQTVLIQYPAANTDTFYVIPDGVVAICDNAFVTSENLWSVRVSKSVKYIGDYAFAWCHRLTDINLPNSIISIGDYAFFYCNMTKVTIPYSVTKIGEAVFASCKNMDEIFVDDSNHYYLNDDRGVLYDRDKTNLIQYPVGNMNSSYEIPDSVVNIGGGAFTSCDALTNIKISKNTEKIGSFAFEGCKNLAKITLPQKVTIIDDYAFRDCGTLQEVNFCSEVTVIGDYAFDSCHSLTSIVVPDSVVSMGIFAFENCKNLTSLTIGKCIETMPSGVFHYCDKLTYVVVVDGVETINYGAFEGCYNLRNIQLPSSIESIAFSAFDDCSALKSVCYQGTEEQWENIDIYGNEPLLEANLHCVADGKFNKYISIKGEPCTSYETKTAYCDVCGATDTIKELGSVHTDNDDDGVCDECGTVMGVETPSVECECNCHKSGITKFFFNFILFFQRLFGANKECACGVAHY